MKDNFNISQLDNKIFSLNVDKLRKEYLENFKKNNTSLAVSIMWPGIVLFSLMWSYISFGIIFAGILFLGQFIPFFAIDFNLLYLFIFSIIYFVFFLLLVTTQQLKIEYARHYESGLYIGLNSFRENFQWAKENLSKEEFNNLVEKEFKVQKN